MPICAHNRPASMVRYSPASCSPAGTASQPGIDGMIAASRANLAAMTDKTIIIPGHGKPVSNRAELKEFRDMLVAIRESVAALKKQGRSRDETVAVKPTAAFDAKWGNFVIDPGFFTRLVYEGARSC